MLYPPYTPPPTVFLCVTQPCHVPALVAPETMSGVSDPLSRVKVGTFRRPEDAPEPTDPEKQEVRILKVCFYSNSFNPGKNFKLVKCTVHTQVQVRGQRFCQTPPKVAQTLCSEPSACWNQDPGWVFNGMHFPCWEVGRMFAIKKQISLINCLICCYCSESPSLKDCSMMLFHWRGQEWGVDHGSFPAVLRAISSCILLCSGGQQGARLGPCLPPCKVPLALNAASLGQLCSLTETILSHGPEHSFPMTTFKLISLTVAGGVRLEANPANKAGLSWLSPPRPAVEGAPDVVGGWVDGCWQQLLHQALSILLLSGTVCNGSGKQMLLIV